MAGQAIDYVALREKVFMGTLSISGAVRKLMRLGFDEHKATFMASSWAKGLTQRSYMVYGGIR